MVKTIEVEYGCPYCGSGDIDENYCNDCKRNFTSPITLSVVAVEDDPDLELLWISARQYHKSHIEA